MASDYPTAIDSFVDPSPSDDEKVVSHALQHSKANDALSAIENELGINPSGTALDLKTRLTSADFATATAFATSIAFGA